VVRVLSPLHLLVVAMMMRMPPLQVLLHPLRRLHPLHPLRKHQLHVVL